MFPPDDHRFGIVRARRGDGERRVSARIAERLAVRVPVPFPAEDAETGDGKPRERFADEIWNRAEVLGDDFGAGGTKQAEDPLTERHLCGLIGRREKGFAPVDGAAVGSIEADEVIDPVSVVEIRAAARALSKPAVILAGNHIPAVYGHAPVLARGAECVRRHAQRCVEAELVLTRPHVGAVAIHHEWQVAEELDTARARTRTLPLESGLPL